MLPSAHVHFDPFELDLATGELRRDGEPVSVPAQAALLLTVLVERAGRLVPRRELISRLWPDRYVDFDQGLHNTVRQLRAALGDDPRRPRFIETVPRQGYRFVASVTPADEAVPRKGWHLGGRDRLSRKGWYLVAVAILGVLVAGGRWLQEVRRPGEVSAEQGLTPRLREQYLEARYLLRRPSPEAASEAERRLRSVVDAAPGLVEARVALAEALLVSGSANLEELRRLAESALALDPDAVGAHLLRSRVALTREWNWEIAERHSERALELAPLDPMSHLVHAFHAASLGRSADAVAAGERARELDPLSAVVQGDLAFLYFWADDWEGVLRESERFLALEPGHRPTRSLRLEALLRAERWEEARREARDLLGGGDSQLAAVPGPEIRRCYLAIQRERWEAAEPGAVRSMVLASITAELGDRSAALRHLTAAVDETSAYLPFVPVDPHLAVLASEPAFRRLLARAGHPLASGGGPSRVAALG